MTCDWYPMDTAPTDRQILVVDADGSRAIVEWVQSRRSQGYWSLTEAGSYAEDTEFNAVAWAPGALPDPPRHPPAERRYWWDDLIQGPIVRDVQ